jgi:hypothetical protein
MSYNSVGPYLTFLNEKMKLGRHSGNWGRVCLDEQTGPYRIICTAHGGCPNRTSKLKQFAPNLSLANEIRRCMRVQGSKGAQFGHKFQRTKERQRVGWWNRTFSGSPAFVAVVQATDLR